MLDLRLLRAPLLVALGLSASHAWPAFGMSEDAWVPKDERKAAPKLSLRDLDGQKRQLSDLKGKVVVVNFWATWCGPCKSEMPEFATVHAAYRDRGVEFIGAANERRSSRAKVQEFVRNLDVRFPIWLEASLDHMEAFGVGPGLPATAIVDSQGRIAARITGPADAAQLRTLLERILLEPTSGPPRVNGPSDPSQPQAADP